MFNLLNDDANKVDLSLGENSTEDEDDNVEGWIDEVELLTDEECETLDNHIEPLWKLISKVRIQKKKEHTTEVQSHRSTSFPSR